MAKPAKEPEVAESSSLSPSLETPEKILINKDPAPQSPGTRKRTPKKTHPDKPVLEQKEVDGKVKAKREMFSGRSISLASFRLPSFRSPGRRRRSRERRRQQEEESIRLQQQPVRGEMETLDLAQLINVEDIS